MEISGFPHYENVCSNILAFFFDPAEEHGFGDLLLRAFFKMVAENPPADWNEPEIPNEVTISREYPAPNRQRIDLVIEAETFVIGIENKIFHWVANDLENYATVIDGLGGNKPRVKAILCLRSQPNDTPPSGGFIRYTYPDLWSHVRDLLGHSITNASNKWLIHLTEFMDTTNNLAGESQEEREVTEFFAKHHNLIEDLVQQRDKLLKRIATRIQGIYEAIQDIPEAERFSEGRFIWKSVTTGSNFIIQGQKIGMGVDGSLESWRIYLYLDKGNDPSVLQKIIETPPMRQLFPELQFHKEMTLQNWDTSASDPELREAYRAALEAFTKAADLLQESV